MPREYTRTDWLDHVVSGETVIHQGTPMSATNFNNLEDAAELSLMHQAAAMAEGMVQISQMGRDLIPVRDTAGLHHQMMMEAFQQINDLAWEHDKNRNQRYLQGEETITGSGEPYFHGGEYPMCVVPFPDGSYPQVNTPDYDVALTVLDASDMGMVGNIEAYDKTQNGFKVRITGSATGVTFMWTLLNPQVR